MNKFDNVCKRIEDFTKDRNWEQFHVSALFGGKK